MSRDTVVHMAGGALIGAVMALAVFPIGFVTGHGQFWLRPPQDPTAYLTTWEYFLHDQWRFPILSLPAMGYPEGGSVLFVDALPLAQLLSKAAYSVTGVAVNPYGWWMALLYVLQGAFAVRLVRAAGARSPLASAAAAIFAVGCQPFIGRIWHFALSSHFPILWAMALYFENVHDRRFTAGEHFAVSAVALLVNPYLFVMVGILQAATVVRLWSRRLLVKSDWQRLVLLVVGVGAIGGVLGYGAITSGPATMRAMGFGLFSWNLMTLVVPPEAYWGFPTGLVRDATGGQYEGEAYIGLGAVILATVCLVTCARPLLAAMRRHWPLVTALVLFAAYAASHRVFLGSRLVLEVPIPERLLNLAAFFRADGRFVWVVVYATSLLSLAGMFRWHRPVIVVPLVLTAALLQAREASVKLQSVRTQLAAPFGPDLVDNAQLTTWLGRHHRLFQFPSHSCGGLWDHVEATRAEQIARELQIQRIVAKAAVATNSMYTARQLKDCVLEAKWADAATIVPDVLYLLNKVEVSRTEPLAALARSNACIDVKWAYACSTQDLTADGGRQD